MTLLAIFEVQIVWVWCRDSCEAASVRGLGFGHTESVLTDTELELGLDLLQLGKSCKQEGQTMKTLDFFLSVAEQGR